jgi:hypothetical protein
MATVTIQVPDDAFKALHRSPQATTAGLTDDAEATRATIMIH